jgi:cellulose synthase/poly-beta-1,6-N-acetylglucosamine synthase-like glycosyltransferase
MALVVGFEVLTSVFTNIAISCDIAHCSPYVNQRFGGTYHLHLQGRKSAEHETCVHYECIVPSCLLHAGFLFGRLSLFFTPLSLIFFLFSHSVFHMLQFLYSIFYYPSLYSLCILPLLFFILAVFLPYFSSASRRSQSKHVTHSAANSRCASSVWILASI